jgi:hypothetical protein
MVVRVSRLAVVTQNNATVMKPMPKATTVVTEILEYWVDTMIVTSRAIQQRTARVMRFDMRPPKKIEDGANRLRSET